MEDHEITALPLTIHMSADKLTRLLRSATAKQWQRQPVHHMDKAGGGAASLVSNPTADIALDTGRLRLRATVLASGRELAAIDERLRNITARLERALEEYHS